MERYNLTLEPQAGCEWASDSMEFLDIIPVKDSNGKWVKWEDVQNLLSELGILTGKDADAIIKSALQEPTVKSIEHNEECLKTLREIRK